MNKVIVKTRMYFNRIGWWLNLPDPVIALKDNSSPVANQYQHLRKHHSGIKLDA